MYIYRGITVTERAGTLFRKFLIRTQAGTLFFLALYNTTPLRPNMRPLFAFRNLYQNKNSAVYTTYIETYILIYVHYIGAE